MRPVVYIAGPLRKGHQLDHIGRALDVYNHLIVSGYAPYCPHLTAFAQIHVPHENDVYMDMFFAIIAKCDAVLRLDGESVGADEEVAFARERGIPVVEVVGDLDMRDMGKLYEVTKG